jgi:GNAT superfamily N-acetyltransferase
VTVVRRRGKRPPGSGGPAGPGGGGYFVSADPGLLDLDFICAGLARSYWARHRPRPVIERSVVGSLCFGLYEKRGRGQVGFARVVTDGATFSWICDVFVAEGHRGKGLGKLLMSCVVAHPRVTGTVCLLGTRDAHGLYERFGFVRSEMMRRPPAPSGSR